MPALTLLQMVQGILSDMDSDEVNSITDTVESQQVADIIKETYYDLIHSYDLYKNATLLKLQPSGTSARPTHMYLADEITSVDACTVKYHDGEKYRDVHYLQPRDFLDLITQRDSTDTNVQTVVDDVSGVNFYINNDVQPTYFTSFDNKNLIFDSYDATIESTLQNSKTLAYGSTEYGWTMSDTFVPELDNSYLQLLLQESKAMCFVNLQQISNSKVEQRARKLSTNLQRKNLKIGYRDRTPDFGKH